MKAIWLLLCQLPFLNSCLVVRSDECRCPYRFLDYQDVISIPNYITVLSYEIQNPLISGDSCSLSMYCEAGYELIVMDIDKYKHFGEFSADALCDQSTWLVSDDEGFTPFKKLDAFCKEILVECGPEDDSSLIIAYSNALSATKWFESMKLEDSWFLDVVTGFGSIRFDSPIEEDVQVYSSFK
uniref:C-type lectin domain-containing protein n=1 Tax=Caenorhabditis tropicalis TaxID=1561998 RepID=A0A1I7UX18_9PELO